MNKVFMARRITSKLYAAENAVDESIVEMTALLGAMVQARRELGVAATVGAEALEKVGDALAALNQARTAVVEGHHELTRVQDALGIPAAGMGTAPKPVFGSAEQRIAS